MIEFAPNCSGKCSRKRPEKEKKPYYRLKPHYHTHYDGSGYEHDYRPDYKPQYTSPHYHEAPFDDDWPQYKGYGGRSDYDDEDDGEFVIFEYKSSKKGGFEGPRRYGDYDEGYYKQ